MLALAVHGGAGKKFGDEPRRTGLQNALAAGRNILEAGGHAIDAVVAAVVVLEDDPQFNAGYGSVLNEQGAVECDAGLMDGDSLDIGAVAAVRDIRNPVLAARAMLRDPLILLAKQDASDFSRRHGIHLVDPASLIAPQRVGTVTSEERSLEGDTVGAIALDAKGNVAAATSTGGIAGKPAGRIGDSPLPGCGYYAENGLGACSTTGWGEAIARLTLARRALEHLSVGMAVQVAAEQAIALLGGKIEGGAGGLILLDPRGGIGAAWNTAAMSFATWTENGTALIRP